MFSIRSRLCRIEGKDQTGAAQALLQGEKQRAATSCHPERGWAGGRERGISQGRTNAVHRQDRRTYIRNLARSLLASLVGMTRLEARRELLVPTSCYTAALDD